MNQNKQVINLLDFTKESHPFGNVQGKETFRKLSDFIESHPSTVIFGISLKGIEVTDASFPRESVISVAKRYRESKGIYLEQIPNRDILDNWDYAAKAMVQPLVVWDKNKFILLGPTPTSAGKELIDYVLINGSVSASQVADDLEITVPNASTRLKKLVGEGYFLRSEVIAESGGIEYLYQAIK
jgi:hypothetical protein